MKIFVFQFLLLAALVHVVVADLGFLMRAVIVIRSLLLIIFIDDFDK